MIGQNPGIHATPDVTFTGNANAGVNTLEIFYADRERTGAQLDVSADVALTAAVPEPSTWAMMILGFFGVGSLAYRRKSQARASAGLAPTLIFFATWEKQLPPGNLTLPGVFVRRPGFSRSKPVVDVGGAIEREIGTLSPTDSLKRCSRCGTRLEV